MENETVTISSKEQAIELVQAVQQYQYNLFFIDGYDLANRENEEDELEVDTFYYYDTNDHIKLVKCEDQAIINFLLEHIS